MIFSTIKKLPKGKSVKAVAHFCQTTQQSGKIVMADASNVSFDNGIFYAGTFAEKDKGVIQYLPAVSGEEVTLRANGLTMGARTFPQLANCTKVVWAYDKNTNIMVVSGNNATYQLFGGNLKKILDQGLDSIVICQSRLFGLKENRIYVGSPTEMTFQQDLWIDLPTSCVALAYNGNFYALGNDVYKISIDGDESNFKVTKVCCNVGQVVPDTVCAYANKILFVANGHLCCMQNATVKQLAQVDGQATCAAMHQGLFYICSQSDDKSKVTSFSPIDGKIVSTYKVLAQSILSNGNDLFVSDGANLMQLVVKQDKCFWKSQPISFDDTFSTKFLHRLVVQTTTALDIYVNADTLRVYHVKGKDAPQSLLIGGHGKHITVELHSNGTMSVERLYLTARTSEVSL